MTNKKKAIFLSIAIASLSALGGCKTPEEKVVAEKKEASKEISKAEQNVDKVRQKDAEKIADTQGAKKVEDAKIQATEDIAKANKKVQDEKVEATSEISNAEQKAKKDTAPSVP